MPILGVCSWSLHPSSVEELILRVRACGVSAVQLALAPLAEGEWNEAVSAHALHAAGITVASGMLATIGEDYTTLETIRETGGVRQSRYWADNLARAERVAATAQRLGLRLVTFHAGFLPHDRSDPLYELMLDRLRQIASLFKHRSVAVAFETGQESAATLVEVMRDLNDPYVGVNFDPANMILYGMGDPTDSLKQLTPWVKQVHVKDAVATHTPGTWGKEVAVGSGSVDWAAFFSHVTAALPDIDVMIEREAGERRVDDISATSAFVRSLHPRISN